MYLIDTNIWLERFLDQARAEEVSLFLDRIPPERLFITDFAFHSIGVVLSKLGRKDALLRFVQDAFIEGAVSPIHLEPEDIQVVARMMEQFSLDFDDPYQYGAAKKYNLTTVSFDSDFDRPLEEEKPHQKSNNTERKVQTYPVQKARASFQRPCAVRSKPYGWL